MTASLPIYQKASAPIELLPTDLVGERFIQRFPHLWGWIEAQTPQEGQKPQWRTESRYPLEPRIAWKKYLDESVLLGVRFSSYTSYLMLDIDRESQYHPDNNRELFEGIKALLESIGLSREILVRSSDSEGIHLYYFLPWGVHTFTLAVAVEQALLKGGYKIQSGQLESFPNAKYHAWHQITNFNAHRLPLQAGSYILDWDLMPISNSVETLLNYGNWAAKGQDMELLAEALEAAREWVKKNRFYSKKQQSGKEFESDLCAVIAEGWSGYGQTNDLLLKMAAYGRVFKKLSGEDLVAWVVVTATSALGYRQWCRHQHEIEKRAREVASSAERYYVPYPGSPFRDSTYQEHFGKNNLVPFRQNKLRLKTLERVIKVIELLKEEGNFPETAYGRAQAIIKKSKEKYGVGGSQTTLHKPEYLKLWHPAHIEGVSDDKQRDKYPILPDPWDEENKPQDVVETRVLSDLHVCPLYEGGCLQLPAAPEISPVIEMETTVLPDFVVLDSFDSTTFQISLPFPLADSCVLTSPSDDFLTDSSSLSSTHNNSLSPTYPQALPKKPPFCHKPDLSNLQTQGDKAFSQGHYTPAQYRAAISLRLEAIKNSKHKARLLCQIEQLCLLAPQRELLEQCIRYQLMFRSASPILQREAEIWFLNHPLIRLELEAFGVSWTFIQNLQ